MAPPIVDVHTHMYPPAYIDMLRARDTIPMVRTFPQSPEPRLILLESEIEGLDAAARALDTSVDANTDDADADADAGTTSTVRAPGRPLTTHYTSLSQKMHFMDTHGIAISVLSLANPWLDFIPADEAPSAAAEAVNTDFANMCARHPGRLFFFGVLPLTAPVDAVRAAIRHLKRLERCRGVVLGTRGRGRGLDDPALGPVLEALAEAGLIVFLHPHYGLPNEVFGPRAGESGHVLPLSLGFPMETTIAVTRMYLAGIFDDLPNLRLLLAHSGGTLPFLAGRIESCIAHDGFLMSSGRRKDQAGGRRQARDHRSILQVLRESVYLDAVVYSHIGLDAAIAASGSDRLLFGTDHPFFPPLESDEQGPWESVTTNVEAVERAVGKDSADARAIMGENAVRILGLEGKS